MFPQSFLMLLKSKRLKDFSIYFFGQFINVISPLLITPYVIFTCGLENLGIIAMGQSFAYILNVIVDYSSNIMGVKEVSLNRDNYTKLEDVFYSNYLAKIFLFLCVFFLNILLVYFVPFFNNHRVVMFFSTTIILGQTINPTWFFQGTENFKWISIINILSKTLFFLGVFSFVQTKESFIYVNLFLGLGSIIMGFIGYFKIKQEYHFSVRKNHIHSAKKLLLADFSFSLSQLFFSIRNYSPVMIISFFSGNYIAGQFKVVEQIIGLFRTYLQMFFKFSYGFICFEIDKNLNKGIKLWKKTNGINLFLISILLLITFVFSKEILTFFKVEVNILYDLQNYLNIALFIPVFICLTLTMEQLLFSLNKNKAYIRTTIFSTIFNLVGISVLICLFTLKEVFWLLLCTEIMLFIIYLFILRKVFYDHKRVI